VRARASALIARLRGSVLVEEYVDGPEVYVSVAGCPERPLGLMEYGFDDVPPGFPRIRTFDYKWFGLMEAETVQDPRWREPVPARYAVTPFAGTLEDIERICVHAFQLGGGRDWGRVDVRIDARTDTPFVIDVTPNTYLGASSPCAKAALAAGLPYPALVESIVNGALGRERR
jgi:D-alanine-D-alanine ligase